ncbi:MAG TPA: LamG domain-containing protein [Tepidisphaeraceae bacterium]|nr:LamG domain-containing protein [Tepidisphaeraceae bacterium]
MDRAVLQRICLAALALGALWGAAPARGAPATGASTRGDDAAAAAIDAQLKEARQRYEKVMTAARAAAREVLERRRQEAIDRDDVRTSSRIQALTEAVESEATVEEPGPGEELAPTVRRALEDWAVSRQKAAEGLAAALDAAARGYERLRRDEEAEALRRERDQVAWRAVAPPMRPKGLVLHLSFEPLTVAAGADRVTVKDLSGRGNDGEVRGTVRLVKDGRVGHAASFDGKGGDVRCGDGDLLRPPGLLTVAAFVRVKGPVSGPVVSKDDWEELPPERGYVLRVTEGCPDFAVATDDGWRRANTKVALQRGRWHHLAGTFDGRLIRLYVDGVQVATEAVEGKFRPSPFPLIVGRGAFDRSRILVGDVDEVTVYGRPLSDDEVRRLARAK